MIKSAFLAAAAMSLGIAVAAAQNAPTPPATARDPNSAPAAVKAVDTPTFIAEATAANAFEIDSSRLAELNGDDEAVKAFARRMIGDHGEAGRQLADLAAKAKARTPEATGTVGDPWKARMDELAGLTGEAFDRAYVKAQHDAHDQAIRLFTAYGESGDDPDLRAFAVGTLPKLQEHQADLADLSP